MLDLTGRVVLVTGAGDSSGSASGSVGGIVGSGIGSGIVRRFVAAGATVVAHTRNSPTDHLRYPDGTPVATVRADLTTPGGPPGVISETLRPARAPRRAREQRRGPADRPFRHAHR